MLGYCLFPLVVASLLCLAWSNQAYHAALLLVGAPSPCSAAAALTRGVPGALWSLRCSVPFVAATVSDRRRALAVYPVLLLYSSLAWLSLLVS